MQTSIIVALSEKDRGIGKNNELLWHFKKDLQRFKLLTTGHPIIMGRKTFESIGKPLPQRINIVITRNKNYKAPGCILAGSLAKAFSEAEKLSGKAFVIGGGEIYKEALAFADRLYLTIVHADKPADVFFPVWDNFKTIISSEEKTDEKTGVKFTWLTLER